MSKSVPETIVREPIFTRQEQGVVYLFSRYWDKIDTFKGKRICDIHTHFPDYEVEDIETGAVEAVEFEYGLSNFNHYGKPLKGLNEEGIKLLYIVYWDEDDDRKEVLREIKKSFSGKVVFLCLSGYFSPCVEPDSGHLSASWIFTQSKQITETYTFKEIQEDTKALIEDEVFEPMKPQRGLYRIIGFNKGNAEFIECDHWKTIHLFTTTTPFGEDSIPTKLLVKPSGYQSFSGYFDIKYAFIINKGTECVKEYFRNYYFYPYSSFYKESTCFVYSRFKEFTYEQGVALFKYLKSKYTLGIQGSTIIDDAEHIDGIDRIVG